MIKEGVQIGLFLKNLSLKDAFFEAKVSSLLDSMIRKEAFNFFNSKIGELDICNQYSNSPLGTMKHYFPINPICLFIERSVKKEKEFEISENPAKKSISIVLKNCDTTHS